MLGKIRIGGVRDLSLLCPVTHISEVNVDKGGEKGLSFPPDNSFLNVGTEFQSRLYKVGRKGLSLFGPHNVFLATDNKEVAVVVEVARVSRMKPTVYQCLRRGLRVLIVPHKVGFTGHQDFLIFGNSNLCPRKAGPHSLRFHLTIRLDLKNATRFCQAIGLFQVEPIGPEEPNHIRADGMPSRVRHTKTKASYPVHKRPGNNPCCEPI